MKHVTRKMRLGCRISDADGPFHSRHTPVTIAVRRTCLGRLSAFEGAYREAIVAIWRTAGEPERLAATNGRNAAGTGPTLL